MKPEQMVGRSGKGLPCFIPHVPLDKPGRGNSGLRTCPCRGDGREALMGLLIMGHVYHLTLPQKLWGMYMAFHQGGGGLQNGGLPLPLCLILPGVSGGSRARGGPTQVTRHRSRPRSCPEEVEEAGICSKACLMLHCSIRLHTENITSKIKLYEFQESNHRALNPQHRAF